jgi:pimeloyl-ACP methyl ester carboxylesterase
VPVSTEFLDRYDAMLARWPVPVESLDVPGRHGTTRVNMCGVPGGPAVVLLHGGGMTGTAWWRNVGTLARTHRVCAVDLIGDRGRSVYDGEPLRGTAGLTGWLDETLDAIGVPGATLVGHSYGGWIATQYALHAPGRVERLVLLDPTAVMSANRPRFQLRAVPLLFARGRGAYVSFVRWETGGRDLDAQWLELWATPFGGRTTLVWPRRVRAEQLRTLEMPVLVLLAGRSGQNPTARMAEVARAALPDVRIVTLPDATHFTLPQQHPDEIGAALAELL